MAADRGRIPGPQPRLRHSVRLFLLLAGLSLRSYRTYRVDFLISVVNGALFHGVLVVFVVAVLARFGGIGGWSTPEVLLIVGIRTGGHAICALIFGNVVTVPALVREGTFDRFLLMPMSVLSQVLLSRFHVYALGDVLMGTATLTAVLTGLAPQWTPRHWVILGAALINAALIEAGLQIAIAGLGLRHGGLEQLSSGVESVIAVLSPYPISVLPASGRFVFYTLVPVAYVGYLPGAVLLDKPWSTRVPGGLGVLALLVGPLVFAGALRYWRFALGRYEPGRG